MSLTGDMQRYYHAMTKLGVGNKSIYEVGVYLGQSYRAYYYASIPGSTIVYMYFKAPVNEVMYLANRSLTTTSDTVTYTVYRDPTITDVGTPIDKIFNANTIVNNPTGCEWYLGPTYSSIGVEVDKAIVSTAQGTGIGNASSDFAVRILAPGSTFILSVHNENAQPQIVDLKLEWVEIPEKETL